MFFKKKEHFRTFAKFLKSLAEISTHNCLLTKEWVRILFCRLRTFCRLGFCRGFCFCYKICSLHQLPGLSNKVKSQNLCDRWELRRLSLAENLSAAEAGIIQLITQGSKSFFVRESEKFFSGLKDCCAWIMTRATISHWETDATWKPPTAAAANVARRVRPQADGCSRVSSQTLTHLCFVCRGQWKQRLKPRNHRMSQELCKRRIPRNRLQREFRIKEWTQKLLKKDMGKRGYHATGEKEELVCKVWEKKPQAGSNEEKCRDSVSPSPSPSISVRVQRLWEAMLVIHASGTFSRPFCKHFGSSSESFVKHLCISLLNSSLIFVFDFSEFVVLCSRNSSCCCITAIILMFMYHSRTHCPSSWNLGLVSKSRGGDKCILPLGCSNQNIFISKQEDHM